MSGWKKIIVAAKLSRRNNCGFESWKRSSKRGLRTCCTKMRVIVNRTNRIWERFTVPICVLKLSNFLLGTRYTTENLVYDTKKASPSATQMAHPLKEGGLAQLRLKEDVFLSSVSRMMSVLFAPVFFLPPYSFCPRPLRPLTSFFVSGASAMIPASS